MSTIQSTVCRTNPEEIPTKYFPKHGYTNTTRPSYQGHYGGTAPAVRGLTVEESDLPWLVGGV